MSKKLKLYARLAKKPAPVDYRWDDAVTLLMHHGFTATCSGGSHHIFQHTGGLTFTMSKTHPGGLLKPYQVKATLDALHKVSKSKP